jgi:hypothetical protein
VPAATRVCRTLTTWSPRAVCACGGTVARSPVAQWWLIGGKVLPASTGGVPGRRRARRVETGLTEAVGRQWGGGRRPTRWCSTVAGWLRCGRGKRDLAPIRGMAKFGGRSPERGKTTAVLGKIRREGEASGGRRQRYGCGSGGEGGGA